MASDNQGGRGAGQGSRQAVARPGSVNRGFASMDPERQREVADQDRKAARQRGSARDVAAQQALEAAPKGRDRARGSGGGAARPARGRAGRKPDPADDTGEDASG